MSLFGRLFGRDRDDGDADARLVVVDTETSGLDPERDELLAIGAVAVDADGVLPGDSFEVVLRNASAGDSANIALHGIGYRAQANGVPAGDALAAFNEYAAGARCVGFHTEFDRDVLRRACAAANVPFDERPWLDLATLAGALEPSKWRSGHRSLDDWLEAFGIDTVSRHNAAGDAFATAELLLRLRAMAARQGSRGFAGLLRATNQRKWLSDGH
ncbi:DNA polymerase III subunit epsilon [Burkholderiales bacterium]|nr:DNA polymerase III subunit epsilon [Burkholderiales bacterium]